MIRIGKWCVLLGFALSLVSISGCLMEPEPEEELEDRVADAESALTLGDIEQEPSATQLGLDNIVVTPTAMLAPGTSYVTFKVGLVGNPTAACGATLSVVNKATSQAVFSAPVTLTGASVSKGAYVNFPAAADYVARVSLQSTSSCAGGLRSSAIRVAAPGGILASIVPTPAKQWEGWKYLQGYYSHYLASEAGNVMTFKLTQTSATYCSKVSVWIEDSNGKRWSAFDQTINGVTTPAQISVSGFLGLPPSVTGAGLYLPVSSVPPAGWYTIFAKGDSPDCSGQVSQKFEKHLPYEIVLLGATGSYSGHDTYQDYDYSVLTDPSVVFSDVKKYSPDDGCSATLCGFYKGAPTLGVLEHPAFAHIDTPLEIVKCSIVVDSGADFIVGLVNQKATVELTSCDLGHGMAQGSNPGSRATEAGESTRCAST